MKDIINKVFSQPHQKPFVVCRDSTVTYGQLSAMIRKFSGFFQNSGITAGERIVFSSKNESFVSSFFVSLLTNNVTAVFLDADTGHDRAHSIINNCNPKYLFLDRHVIEKWNLREQENRTVFVLEFTQTGNNAVQRLLRKGNENTFFPSLLDSVMESDPLNNYDAERDAYILFTSGTTSAPKGVRISCKALLAHLATLTSVYRMTSQTRIFNNLILSHSDGIAQGPLLAFYNTGTVYRPFPFSIQKIEDHFDLIYREKITHWVLVPTMIGLIWQMKQNDSDSLAQSSLEYFISCAGKLEAGLWKNFEEKFGKRIINGYGLTETVTGGIFAGPDEDSHIIGSIGKPVDCEVKIFGDGREEPRGVHGEIWLRGDMIMSGYLNAPELTDEVLQDGWLKTGDIGFLGDDGCYRITGRKKLIIISGGVNICPEEVTEVIHMHPAVRDAVTLGVEDPVWGEKVASIIVVRDNHSLTSEEIIAHCRQHLEEKKVPVEIRFVRELPYGPSGKVIIEKVREMIREKTGETVTDQELEPLFKSLVAKCFQLPVSEVNLSMKAEDTAAWDSISHLLLIAEMEKNFGVEFTPLEIMNIGMLSDLLQMINEKLKKG